MLLIAFCMGTSKWLCPDDVLLQLNFYTEPSNHNPKNNQPSARLRLLAGQPTLLEMLVHLWKEAVIKTSFVLLGPSDSKVFMCLLRKRFLASLWMKFTPENLSVLNTAMALHKNNAQERSNAGRRFHDKMKLKMHLPKYVSWQQGIGTPFCERRFMHDAHPSQCKSNSHQWIQCVAMSHDKLRTLRITMFVPFFVLEHTHSSIVCRAGSSAAGRRAMFSK